MINPYILEFVGTFVIVYFILLLGKTPFLVSIVTGITTALFIFISSSFVKLNLTPQGYAIPTFNPIIAMCHYFGGLINLIQLIQYVTLEIIAGVCAFLFCKYISNCKRIL